MQNKQSYKLTADQKNEIIKDLKNLESVKKVLSISQIAAKHGISRAYIYKLKDKYIKKT